MYVCRCDKNVEVLGLNLVAGNIQNNNLYYRGNFPPRDLILELMKILVTEANGQLGHVIQLLLDKHKSDNEWIFAGREEFDVTWTEDKIETYLISNKIQTILNLAALVTGLIRLS